MPGLLSIFRAPPLAETDAGPALPPMPVKGTADPPMRVEDKAVPALPPEPVKDHSEVPVLPPKQSLFARRPVVPGADDSAAPRVDTIGETPRGLPAVRTGKKGKKGSSETQQEVMVVDAQAAGSQAGNPAGAQNIVVTVNTAPAVIPYWGWAGCGAWSCPHRRGLVCRRLWCWW